MENLSWRKIILLAGSIIATVSSIVTLYTGIPVIAQSTTGRLFLASIIFISVGYLTFFFYKNFIQSYLDMKKRFNECKSLITQFTVDHANNPFVAEIDVSLINLFVLTKRVRSLPLKVTDLTLLSNDRFQIILDKGANDGINDEMQFKIFHKARMAEIGPCNSSPFPKETTLVVTISPHCPVKQHEIRRDDIEVRIIEPMVNNEINEFLAKMRSLIEKY